MPIDAIELSELRREKKIKQTHAMELGAIMLDMGTIASVFALFTKAFLQAFLEEMGKFFLFPIAAAASLIRATLAWREAYLAKKKDGPIVRALVETAAAVAITGAVIGALAIPAIFAGIAPIIFTATFGLKSVWNTLSAVYYFGKSMATDQPEKKVEYRERAKASAMGALVGTLGTIAIGAVMVFGKVALAPIGIVAGVMGAAYAGYKLYKTVSALSQRKANASLSAGPESSKEEKLGAEHDERLSSSARLSQQFDSKPKLGSGTETPPSLDKKTLQLQASKPKVIGRFPSKKSAPQDQAVIGSAPAVIKYKRG
ncbi:MAG: hypothetical protein A3F14_03540 [Gammaproteobacteria bacterium RIFCSPHIGHO2_12_FULL_43_28]|nr:MAG: hypothetical protein A3F14_03540 [Gammaproteobacteria bacterium RIFCSPHIGHO2_12_FULL_43_28]